MKNGFYKDLDTNFEQAYMLSNKSFCHNELLELLRNGNIPQKQIAALNFDEVNNLEDSETLINNLTGCDGKIREAIALKINQILITNPENIKFFNYPIDFAQATIDINGNICKLAIDSAKILKQNKDFAEQYTLQIINYTQEALEELSKFIFRDKKYVINKQLFKLYWCLEALRYFYDLIDKNILNDILGQSAKQNEYTIREKVAQIIIIIDKEGTLARTLQNDENYYVRQVFLNH